MNNYQLSSYLSRFGTKVVCAEELPVLVFNRPRSFVVNTDSCGRPGKHWTVFYFPKEGQPCEFFDSLGRTPEQYHPRFKYVLTVNGPTYTFLKDRLQALDSDVCGQYCIYYVMQRHSGRSLTDISRDFRRRDYRRNDDIVYKYVKIM